jgi:hypothetical protein
MALALRFVAVCSAVLLACAAADAQPPAAPEPHLALDELVKEYKRLGLPLPPANAELVRVEKPHLWLPTPGARALGPEPRTGRRRSWVEDLIALEKQSHVLAYRVPPKPGGFPLFRIVGWFGVGLQDPEYVEPNAAEVVRPTVDTLRWLHSQDPRFLLAFAAQCWAFGWNDLAGAAYARAREGFVAEKSDRTVLAELRGIAWRFWSFQLTERGTDRKDIHRRLSALREEEPTLRTEYSEWVLDALDKTFAPRKSKPGTVEALIDDLTEYWEHPRASKPYETEPAERAPSWKLAEKGFDAVPALTEHVKDDRLTRAWAVGFNNFPSRHVTVGALCSRLLHQLSDNETGARGVAFLDLPPHEARARAWFEEAKKLGEEKWLMSRALRPAVDRVIGPYKDGAEPLIVWLIGVKYPARLPEVYRVWLKRAPEECPTDGYAPEVLASTLPRDQKLALLEEGARGEGRLRRIAALEALAQAEPRVLAKHLWLELTRIQTEHALANWAWGEWGRRFRWPEPGTEIRLARLTEVADDPLCWDALAGVGMGGYSHGRWIMLATIGAARPLDQNDPHRAGRIRFLLKFINDRAMIGRFDGDMAEVRDDVTDRLAGLLGVRTRLSNSDSDQTRGPLSRAFFRAAVAKMAAEELERLKK